MKPELNVFATTCMAQTTINILIYMVNNLFDAIFKTFVVFVDLAGFDCEASFI